MTSVGGSQAHTESTRVLRPDLAFAIESLSTAWDEAVPLMHANHAEVGGLEGRTFAPKRHLFENVEKAGHLRVYTMRLLGKLIGYGLFMVAESMNYADSVIGISHTVYVTPEHRGRRAIQFMLWQDKQLERDGVNDFMRQSPAKHENGRTYEHMGYHPVETVFVKSL